MVVCCPRCGVWQRAQVWFEVVWWLLCGGCGVVRWQARLNGETVRRGPRVKEVNG